MQAKKRNNKILLTGGHAATTAIAAIEKLKEEEKGLEIHWAGPLYAVEGTKVKTLSYQALPKMGVTFHRIIFGRLQRKLTPRFFLSLFKVPVGFFRAVYLLLKIKPKVILSFGGYASFPVVFVGFLFRIPVVIHDQTSSFSLSNRIAAPFAAKIALSRKSSLRYYPEEKCSVTGNLVMKDIRKLRAKKSKAKVPVVYVTGGSVGAQSINSLIEEILEEILARFSLIHQTGQLDYKKFKKIKEKLPPKLSGQYKVHANISPFKVAEVIEKADIIISRAGANTVSEIMIAKRPAILIPLTISNWEEQRKNAKVAKDFGIAKVLEQDSLTSGELLQELRGVEENWTSMIEKVKNKKSPDHQAASKVYKLLKEYL